MAFSTARVASVKDVCQAAIGLDTSGPLRRVGGSVLLDEAQRKSVIAHRLTSIWLYDRSGAPFFSSEHKVKRGGNQLVSPC